MDFANEIQNVKNHTIEIEKKGYIHIENKKWLPWQQDRRKDD